MPDEFVKSMKIKKTCIAHGEAFATTFTVDHEKEILRSASVLWVIDNLGVSSAVCRSSSTEPDINCIVSATLLGLARLRTLAWFEWVESHANVSDGGTRNSNVVANLIGVKLEVKEWLRWWTR